MSLTVGTAVEFTTTTSGYMGQGVISEIEGTTFILQMENGQEHYAGASELEAITPDFKSWNNYKLVNILERAIRLNFGDDYIMDLQNEIFSRMNG